MSVKTPQQVRAELARKGISIAQWAAAHNLNVNLVYETLAGRKKGTRGESHRAMVLLGLKEGEVVEASQVVFHVKDGDERLAA